jgi:hypothetical protein
MELVLKRNNGNGIVASCDKLGLVIVFQSTTKSEHQNIIEGLETVFGDCDVVDIFYDYKSTSIFIYDTTLDALSDQDLSYIKEGVSDGGKRKYTVILNGKIQNQNGNFIDQLLIKETKNGFYVSKQSNNLLTMSIAAEYLNNDNQT